MIKELKKDNLLCRIFENRDLMGKSAAKDIHDKMMELLKEKRFINMIFAAAPSQNEVLEELVKMADIPWDRVNAFHMDEYIGLKDDAPQSFCKFLKNAIFDKLQFKSVNLINGNTDDIAAECERYTKLLKENPVDIVCLGIGENGHIAFNDPGVADFNDAEYIKIANLDDVCRSQQVNDGCFETFDEVPKYALTLTIPALIAAKYMICVVPAKTKAQAVKKTMLDKIDEECPATIMRTHKNAVLYCDKDSGQYLI